MDNTKVYKVVNGNKTEIANPATAKFIGDLLTASPSSQLAFEIANNEKVIKAMATGAGTYEVTGINSDKESVTVRMNKADVQKYASGVLAISKAITDAMTLRKVDGELGKRGRSAVELDLEQF